MIRNDCDELEGKRLQFFNYTGTRLIGIKEYNQMVSAEIGRVANLPYDNRVSQGWAGMEKRPDGMLLCFVLYSGDW
jgi:hypothetical protein